MYYLAFVVVFFGFLVSSFGGCTIVKGGVGGTEILVSQSSSEMPRTEDVYLIVGYDANAAGDFMRFRFYTENEMIRSDRICLLVKVFSEEKAKRMFKIAEEVKGAQIVFDETSSLQPRGRIRGSDHRSYRAYTAPAGFIELVKSIRRKRVPSAPEVLIGGVGGEKGESSSEEKGVKISGKIEGTMKQKK